MLCGAGADERLIDVGLRMVGLRGEGPSESQGEEPSADERRIDVGLRMEGLRGEGPSESQGDGPIANERRIDVGLCIEELRGDGPSELQGEEPSDFCTSFGLEARGECNTAADPVTTGVGIKGLSSATSERTPGCHARDKEALCAEPGFSFLVPSDGFAAWHADADGDTHGLVSLWLTSFDDRDDNGG